MPLPRIVTLNAMKVAGAAPERHRAARSIVVLPSNNLGLDMQHQELFNWCWAAVSVSVKRFYERGNPITQCQQASLQLKWPCCDDPGPCNRTWRLKAALEGLGNLRALVSGTLPIEAIRREIDDHHPLCCFIAWTDGGGHFVCIDGYDVTALEPMLTIQDPAYGTNYAPLTIFLTEYQKTGSWTESYTTKP